MMAVFFFTAHKKGFKFHAQPQTGAYSCWLLCRKIRFFSLVGVMATLRSRCPKNTNSNVQKVQVTTELNLKGMHVKYDITAPAMQTIGINIACVPIDIAINTGQDATRKRRGWPKEGEKTNTVLLCIEERFAARKSTRTEKRKNKFQKIGKIARWRLALDTERGRQRLQEELRRLRKEGEGDIAMFPWNGWSLVLCKHWTGLGKHLAVYTTNVARVTFR